MTQPFEPTTPFFAGNSTFIEELYERYLQNPQGVDESWRAFFKDVTNGSAKPAKRDASWAQIKSQVIGIVPQDDKLTAGKDKDKKPGAGVSLAQMEAYAHDSIRVIMMVRAYRVRGHLMANLDPLGIEERGHHPELNPATYGFTEADMDREMFIDGS